MRRPSVSPSCRIPPLDDGGGRLRALRWPRSALGVCARLDRFTPTSSSPTAPHSAWPTPPSDAGDLPELTTIGRSTDRGQGDNLSAQKEVPLSLGNSSRQKRAQKSRLSRTAGPIVSQRGTIGPAHRRCCMLTGSTARRRSRDCLQFFRAGQVHARHGARGACRGVQECLSRWADPGSARPCQSHWVRVELPLVSSASWPRAPNAQTTRTRGQVGLA